MIEIKDNKITINGIEIKSIELVDGTSVNLQHEDTKRIFLDNAKNGHLFSYLKNIVSPGSTINCGGDFHLGDK